MRPIRLPDLFREPEISIRAGCDAVGPGASAYSFTEFGDDASWRNPSDRVAEAFGKPQVAIWTGGDPLQAGARADAVAELGEVAVDDGFVCLGRTPTERRYASEYDEHTQDLVHE